MKTTFSSLFSLLILAWAAWFSISSQTPKEDNDLRFRYGYENDKALNWVETLSQKPRYVGSKFHDESKNIIQNYLSELGLENHSQSGLVSNSYGSLTLAQNVVAKIEGTSKDASTMLIMAHYDSAMIHSHGASDNLSGVAVILETLRAIKESEFNPENNLIFLFSDAEEIGLLGAQLFVEEHPWASSVDFTVNFEARGTSGPSNMIIETNHGNKQIIQEFAQSNPSYPVANSLMYGVYKMLPNDTDSTVFREVLDVPGLFFAFIDDHQHYHTSLDDFQHLDSNSMLHHAYYLNEIIEHFSAINLKQLRSEKDLLYFNFPALGMISFSISLAIIILIVSVLLFGGLAYYGFKQNMINTKLLVISSIRLTLFLITSGLVIYGIWYLTKLAIPHYQDYIHGFSYNAHLYMAFCFAFVIGLGFLFYRTPSNKYSNLYASFPAFFLWLVLLMLSLIFFPGLAYLILPFFFLLIAYLLLFFNQTKNSSLFKLLFGLPMWLVMVPLLQNFIVGLGLDAMPVVAVLSALLFATFLPIIGFYPFKKSFGYFAFCIAIFYWANAFVKKGPSMDSPYFTSLNYTVDLDSKTASWTTYNKFITPWLSSVFGEERPKEATSNQKGGLNIQLTREADYHSFDQSKINLLGVNRLYIRPHSETSSIQLFSKDYEAVLQVRVNGKLLNKKDFFNSYLMRYYVVHQEPLEIEFVTEQDQPIELSIQEIRPTLLADERFSLRDRPRNEIAMPFVTTDAVLINYKLQLNDE